MNRMHWTIPEAVDLLAEAHWVDMGGQGLDPDPITLDALAQALAARPEVLEEVRKAWEDELPLAEWSQERRDQANSWLDAFVLDGLSNPDAS